MSTRIYSDVVQECDQSQRMSPETDPVRKHKEDESRDEAVQAVSLTARVLAHTATDSPFFDSRPPISITLFDPSEVLLGRVLGQGQFGTVREVNHLSLSGDFDSLRSALQDSISPSLSASAFGRLYEDRDDDLEEPTGGGDGSASASSNPNPALTELEKSRLTMRELHQRKSRYAVKRVREDLSGKKKIGAAVDLAAEAMFLSSIAHPNIVRIRGVAGIPGHPSFCLVMDRLYLTLEEKIDHWKEELGCCLEWRLLFGGYTELVVERIMVAFDLSRALNFLHQHNIIFRDLKPSNLGFDVKGNVKLFDFGVVKELKSRMLVERDLYNCTPLTGTRRWMAPEVVLSKPYGLKADVYGFGLLFWHLCTLEIPFGKSLTKDIHLHWVIQGGRRPPVPSFLPKSLQVLMQNCWDGSSENRPALDKVGTSLAKEIAGFHLRRKSSVMARSQYLRQCSATSMKNAFEMAGLANLQKSSEFFVSGSVKETGFVAEEQVETEATEQSAATLTWNKHCLFNSALECQMPSHWSNASGLNEEVTGEQNQVLWQASDEDAGVAVVKVDIRKMLPIEESKKNDVTALYFQEIGESWGMEEETLKICSSSSFSNDATFLPPRLLPQSTLSCAKGSFAIDGESGCLINVYCELCVIRLPVTKTDLIVSLSTSVELEEMSEEVFLSDIFCRFIGSFRAQDWNLISWKEQNVG